MYSNHFVIRYVRNNKSLCSTSVSRERLDEAIKRLGLASNIEVLGVELSVVAQDWMSDMISDLVIIK